MVHPHAGGEHALPNSVSVLRDGPSPRGWGALVLALGAGHKDRTIPTRVGSTAPGTRQQSESADHPHAGGEHRSQVFHARAAVGPSPRGWGAPNQTDILIHIDRTIPTRVGSTESHVEVVGMVSDHPHAGGEHQQTARWKRATNGPSPRGWGAPGRAEKHGSTCRTIPTRVGSTLTEIVGEYRERDHPHAGGEHHQGRIMQTVAIGPSPRGWGARLKRVRSFPRLRTIPTRVGSTTPRLRPQQAYSDHPHAGGEHVIRPP